MAQSRMVDQYAISYTEQNASTTDRDTKIDVQLDQVSLDQALQTIARQANIRVTLGEDVLRTSKRVTVHLKDVTVAQAFREVLQGTGIKVSMATSTQAVFVRAPSSQQQGTVQGRVLHQKTRQPISGAIVTGSDGTPRTTTDADGRFTLRLPAGDQAIHIRAVGYEPQKRTVSVYEDQGTALDIVLEPRASVLDQVIVTGTAVATERKEIPHPITVITAEQIEQRGITRIEELMRGEIPGVFALDEGVRVYTNAASGYNGLGGTVRSAVYARGSSGLSRIGGGATPLKTYVDGVELLDPAYLGTIDPRSIERIEIVTGPQAATIYGAGALGGVMQIFTKKGERSLSREWTAAFRYGTLESNLSQGLTPRHNHSAGHSGNAGPILSYATTVSYDYSGQWQPHVFGRRLGASVGLTSRMEPLTISGSFSVTSTRNGVAQNRSGGMLGAVKSQTGEWLPTGYNNLMRTVSTTSNQTMSLRFEHRIRAAWNQSLTIGRSQNIFAMVPQQPSFGSPSDTLYSHSQENGQRTNWDYTTTLSHTLFSRHASALTFGGSGSSANQIRMSACSATDEVTTLEPCYAGGQVYAARSLTDQSIGGYGSWRVGVFNQIFFTLGLRYEHNPKYGRSHKIDWTPTNGLAYSKDFGDVTVKVLGSYGRATRTPPADRKAELNSTWGIVARSRSTITNSGSRISFRMSESRTTASNM